MSRAAVRTGRRSLQRRSPVRLLAAVTLTASIVLLFAPAALADCPVTDPNCAIDSVGQTTKQVTDAADDPIGATNNAVDDAKKQADGAVKQVTDTVDGILNPGGEDGGGGGGGGSGGGSGHHNGGGPGRNATPGAVSGSGITRPPTIVDGNSGPLPTEQAPHRATHGPSTLGKMGGALGNAARQVAFPLALALVVLLFLLIQNRIDSRDPHLALSPIAPDVMKFS